MATLVANYGGRPLSAPALREVPVDENTEALALIDAVVAGEIDIVVLLTGVGTRALLSIVDHLRDRAAFVSALSRTKVAARGPKPVAVLRELGLTPWVVAPEPNTWRELIAAIDAKVGARGIVGARIAVQEYGVSNPVFLRELRERGAAVTRAPIYRWALPEDVEPLRLAAGSIAGGALDVAIFTTATQVVHLLQVAATVGLHGDVIKGLRSMVVASIGPTTSEQLREQGLAVDIEASHPKMGVLVRDAAERAAMVLKVKRPGVELR